MYAAGDRVPLGLLYISSALSSRGIDNEVFDLNHFEVENLLEKIKKDRPEWVGLSIVSSPSFEQMKKLGEKIKEISSETKIVVGGAHATAMPESLIEIADAVVVGNGERGICGKPSYPPQKEFSREKQKRRQGSSLVYWKWQAHFGAN